MELKGTRLAVVLNDRIDSMVDDNTDRSDVIAEMARASRISDSTVGQILRAEINCPPLSRLRAFARVLNVAMSRLRNTAESDGCEYGDDGKALVCRFDTKSDIVRRLDGIKRRLTKNI